ncbi:NAD(P)-dependent oxidoreductase [Bailinhaonella thermotolerans]|uniref:Hydroxyacid dehydrogenase n=1 Tax=Bailinhaonella thermotolerans TaxID=1070861 RepID=A0A3A4ANT5_9ACTN|nr:NAD(P)-dependent oxidoreductase [Bailinhaonella thermotolerans]RJL30125.1 hydroxyacid dehydrogenase [Bailinhaonella thermotolerans]
MTRLLAAGDHFVLNRLIVEAVRAAADGAADLEIGELELPWPLEPFGPVAEVDEASGTEDELIGALGGAEICVTQLAPLTARVLAACPDLRLACVTRGGPVNVNLAAAARHGVAVCAAPGRNAAATAEHAVGLILAAIRRIPSTHGELLAGRWRGDHYRYDAVGPELDGATVGLVGYGAVGRRVARALAGLGARVLVSDPYARDVPGDVERVPLGDLLRRSLVVSLHARATEETAGLIGAAEIAAMPYGSILVNCARGALLDYDALCDALDSGHLYAAALDVYPAEPLPPGSRLLTTPGLTLTPHIAGASRETAEKAARIAAAEVARHLTGAPLRHRVTPDDRA